ncbi:MAG: radical SAM protein [Clostridia bacterium]
MNLKFNEIYYEPAALEYPLGKMLREKYTALPWKEIDSHNNIPELRAASNRDFPKLKRKLIIGVRKTHKYTENHKVSDFLVPYTSSGCSAMCLYCYLVCNYNKCAYLRVFVNREQMLEKLIRTANEAERPLVFEIGSNSDLILENEVTGNLPWTIETFGAEANGSLTFPTKFDMVSPLLCLDHRKKTIFRMSVNPSSIIQTAELGTSPLAARIRALNAMCDAEYPVGLLIAPVILVPEWKQLYSGLIDELADTLSAKVKNSAFIEIIFMTYSFVQNAINQEALPHSAFIFQKDLMTGRGNGKYCYKDAIRKEAEAFLREQLERKLRGMRILYIV